MTRIKNSFEVDRSSGITSSIWYCMPLGLVWWSGCSNRIQTHGHFWHEGHMRSIQCDISTVNLLISPWTGQQRLTIHWFLIWSILELEWHTNPSLRGEFSQPFSLYLSKAGNVAILTWSHILSNSGLYMWPIQIIISRRLLPNSSLCFLQLPENLRRWDA